MISFASIWAIVLRYASLWKRDINFLLGIFYWPFLDIIIWGFLGAWITQSQATQEYDYQSIALLGILLWQFVSSACNVMLMAFSEELWSNNVVNLFSLPLCIEEWIGSIIIFTAIIMSIKSLFSLLVIYALYNVGMVSLTTTFLLFFLPLFFSGIWIGFTCLSCIVILGKRGIELGYAFAWMLLPFSGAYYPISVLPSWGQTLSTFLPMSHVFQGMREYVMHKQDPTPYLIKGYLLSITYAACALIFFVYCFNRSKQKGLARLVD